MSIYLLPVETSIKQIERRAGVCVQVSDVFTITVLLIYPILKDIK